MGHRDYVVQGKEKIYVLSRNLGKGQTNLKFDERMICGLLLQFKAEIGVNFTLWDN